MEYFFPDMRMITIGMLACAAIFSVCVSADDRGLIQNGRVTNMTLKDSDWRQAAKWIEGAGVGNDLSDGVTLEAGDFRIKARLRMLKQSGNATSFFLGLNHFGFEGARDTMFLSGPFFGGVKLLGPAEQVVPRGEWIDFEMVCKAGVIRFLMNNKEQARAMHAGPFERIGFRPWRATMQVQQFSVRSKLVKITPLLSRVYTIPTLHLSAQKYRQVIVDREKGQYLGHPTTVLLGDGKTMLIVYPKGHGKGGIVYKRITDGG